jgi:hypothetical protein
MLEENGAELSKVGKGTGTAATAHQHVVYRDVSQISRSSMSSLHCVGNVASQMGFCRSVVGLVSAIWRQTNLSWC